MTVLRILQDGAPELRRRSTPVTTFGEALDGFISDLVQTMFAADGIGLAAPQVGRNERVIVVGIDGPRGSVWRMVNPVITGRSGRQRSAEGCLSVARRHWNQPVNRALRIWVHYHDTVGREQHLKARGLLAAAIQHEIDHLDGVLFTDHLRPGGAVKARA